MRKMFGFLKIFRRKRSLMHASRTTRKEINILKEINLNLCASVAEMYTENETLQRRIEKLEKQLKEGHYESVQPSLTSMKLSLN